MSLMMGTMEKKIHLIKCSRGFTLVEVMATLAILLILFGGISTLMINTVKIQSKSSTFLHNSAYIKSALIMFDIKSGGDIDGDNLSGIKQYISSEVFDNVYKDKDVYCYFSNIDEMQEKLVAGNVENSKDIAKKHGYELNLIITRQSGDGNLYLVTAALKNLNKKNDDITKTLYINR